MNVLVLGSGGREHAIAWKIAQSTLLDELYIAPGNAGTKKIGKNIRIVPSDFKSIGDFVVERGIEMVVVGPETPLVNGIYDYFRNHAHLAHVTVIGASKAGAMIEGSKDFAKQFMQRYNIPTASFESFNKDRVSEGKAFLEGLKPPYVLKADGLASGKGVEIFSDLQAAQQELANMLEGKFGSASERVVIEEYLEGIEASVFVFTDGKNYKILPAAKDYKKIGEGDTGPNTGGMGAVSPVPFVDDEFMQKVEEQIIQPTLAGFQKEGITYKGFLYIGLMNVKGHPYVVEYNARMGDPEAQVVIPRIQSDMLELFQHVAHESLPAAEVRFDPRATATVTLASEGYPGKYEKDKPITFDRDPDQSIVFHAGTKISGRKMVTNGGRVMSVTAYGADIQKALNQCYEDIELISFEGKYYRRDIGFDIL